MHCTFSRAARTVVRGAVALAGVVLLGGPALAEAADPVEIKPLPNTPLPSVQVVPKGGGDLSIPACRGVVWQRFDAPSEGYVPISLEPCGAMAPASVLPDDGRRFTVDAEVVDGDVARAVIVVGTGCASGQVFSLAGCKSVVAVEGPTITVRSSKK